MDGEVLVGGELVEFDDWRSYEMISVFRGSAETGWWLQIMSREEYDRTGGKLVVDASLDR